MAALRSVLLLAAAVAVALAAVAGAAAGRRTHGAPLSFLGRVRGRDARPAPLADALRRSASSSGGALSGSLSASPSKLCAGVGNHTVSWSGVEGAERTDFVAVYSPPTAEAHDYLDYFWVRDADGWEGGSGEVPLTLINMREDYGFRYYREGGGSNYNLVAVSNNVSVCADLPLQGHLSLTDDPSEMALTWVSGRGGGGGGGGGQQPQVRFGASPRSLGRVARGSSRTYAAGDMCNAPANETAALRYRDPGLIHDAVMTGLPPSSTVYYQFGFGGGGPWSDVQFFVTAPRPSARANVSFLMFGDMGAGVYVPPAARTADVLRRQVLAGTVDFALLHGDISYARAKGWVWDLYGLLMEPVTTRVPLQVGVGNHEHDYSPGAHGDARNPMGAAGRPWPSNAEDDSDGECGVPTAARYRGTGNGEGVYYYSFDYGPVHVAVLATELDPSPGSPMSRWLDADLAAVDRAATPWVVVSGHRPMYQAENYTSDAEVAEALRVRLEPLLHRHGVDAYVNGHYHSTLVTSPVLEHRAVPSGTRHFLVGNAGASLDRAAWLPREWDVYHSSTEFMYSRFSAVSSPSAGTTTLTFELHRTSNDTIAFSTQMVKRLE